MGYQNQRFALVSMTNKDVYYLTRDNAEQLMSLMQDDNGFAFFETSDAKSGAKIVLSIKNVSSVVIPEGFHQLGGHNA